MSSFATPPPRPNLATIPLSQRAFTWMLLYFLLIIAAMAVLIMRYESNGLIMALVFAGVAIVTPLLCQWERMLFWVWIVGFPVIYYDPVRIASVVLGASATITVPFFLLATLPAAVVGLWTKRREHRQILALTFPLWIILVGMMMNLTRFYELFSRVYWIRDTAGLFVILFLLVLAWRVMKEDKLGKARIHWLLLGIGVANGLTIVAEHYLRFGMVVAGGFERPMGLFGFPILASFISLVSLVLGLYTFFTVETRKRRLLTGGFIAIILMGCLMSLTKTNITQLGIILTLWMLFLPRAYKRQAIPAMIILVVLLVLWEVLFDHGRLWTQLLSRFGRTDTLAIRQSAWQIVVEHLDAPALLWGHGWMSATALLGTYNYNYALFPVDLMSKGGASAIHPHNAYLKYAYEMGIFGIGMLVGFFVLMVRGYWDALRASTLPQRVACLGCGTLMLVMLFASITGSPMAETYSLLFFYTTFLTIGAQTPWVSGAPPVTDKPSV